ncbi:F0F1 ATP synthase subunit delta [Rhodosalinus sediminis]|uniref:ATP synthase subunit delta n=1 Tax=Rhodosalinus sediminis TaxID=1940533 RepID=A0A3D9BWV5_9RHOB|nr:F0F1 ATP synthase subunit delta [Rhodosalinus sediminis]REC57968.1 F0F1 ATP synthase subunit delta [Rhodosalinus sediminis]
MSESASISSGIAARYATAIFELARESDALDALERGVDDLGAALEASADLRDLIASPVYTRDDQKAAILAVAEKMGLPAALRNALGLMAEKRRLFVLPSLVAQLRERIARHKGEVTADVTSAQPLSDAQTKKLAETLRARIGQDVKINAAVDESLIGGLVVKVGSVMIDSSVRARLAALQNAMKEVG